MKLLRWIPAVFIAGCSFYLSSKTHIEHMPSFWNADKLVHFFCYAGFCFWVSFACQIKDYKKIWLPVLIVSLWGASDEIHQSFVPGRSVSVLDWMSDTLGAALGSFIYLWFVTKVLPALQGRSNRP